MIVVKLLVDLFATVGTWSWFVLTLVVFDPVLRFSRLFGERPMDRAVSAMCRCLSWCIPLGLCRLRIEGRENAPRDGRLIVVSNHQSLVENFLPLWVLDHLRPRYVAKSSMGRWIPAVSYNLRRLGHALIDRGDRVQALAAISRLAERMKAGEISTMIFPEGTRSRTGQMSTFKRAGLAVLLDAAPDTPVLPVVFHGGNRVFPRGLPRVRAFSTVRMKVLPPVERLGRSVEEMVELLGALLRTEFEQMQAEAGELVAVEA